MGWYLHAVPADGGLEVQDFYNEYAKEVGVVSGGGVHVSSEDYSNSVSMKKLRDIAGNWANFQDYLRR